MKIPTCFSVALLGLAVFAAGHARASALAYLDTATYLGYYVAGGATSANPTTNLLADDLQFPAEFWGRTFDAAAVYIQNPTTSTFTARLNERFYAADGVNGGPGTLLSSFAYRFSLVAGDASLCGSPSPLPVANQFTIPTNGRVWAAVFIDNVGSSANVAQLNMLGVGIFGPPQLGTSADLDFLGAGPGSYLTNNPAGTLRTAPFTDDSFAANYGWQISVVSVVPEPSAIVFTVAGSAGLGMLALRRRARAVF